jgi:hypothetical protein
LQLNLQKISQVFLHFASWLLVAFISCDKKNSVLGVSAGGPWERNMVGREGDEW